MSTVTVPPVVAAYRTCELVTVGPDGTPTAWPTSHFLNPDGSILVTTSIGLPQKAFNVRRDPRVALLCSNPTASGLTAPEQVLVQGTAVCPDEIRASPAGLEDYWRMLFERQDSPLQPGNPMVRWSSAWYFSRLVLTITPETVTTLPPLPAPGAAAEPAPARAVRDDAAGRAARATAGFDSAVLASTDADGRLRLTRVRHVFDAADGSFVLPAPAGDPVAGPASLLCHDHDERLMGLRCSNVAGTLEPGADGTVRLRPRRLLADETAGLREVLGRLRGCRRSAAGYLRRRGLEAPDVDWAGYVAIRAEAKRMTA